MTDETKGPNEIVSPFCPHASHGGAIASIGGELRHMKDCGLPIECEFSYLDGVPHAATTIHVDCMVCAAHLGAAVDNVSGR